jgi:hypothetical protein
VSSLIHAMLHITSFVPAHNNLITAAAYALIEKTWPFLLKFLGDEYDDTSCAVLNYVNDTLSLVSAKHSACRSKDAICSNQSGCTSIRSKRKHVYLSFNRSGTFYCLCLVSL